jgi:hypothetical protein
MPTAMEDVSNKARRCFNNPKMLITYLWFTTMLFGFMYAIAAIVAAVNNNGDGEGDSKSLGFVGIWAMILILMLSVGGTMVMRKHQTPLAVGFLIGIVLMMSLQMFSLSIIFAGFAYLARIERAKGEEHTNVHSNEAGSVFSFFMFILYVRHSRDTRRHCRGGRLTNGCVLSPLAGHFRRRAGAPPQHCHQRGRELGPERHQQRHREEPSRSGRQRGCHRHVSAGDPHGPGGAEAAGPARERLSGPPPRSTRSNNQER